MQKPIVTASNLQNMTEQEIRAAVDQIITAWEEREAKKENRNKKNFEKWIEPIRRKK